ncbi:MAG: HAD family hydrolase [Planctomycetota bacterium]|jgi:putative hydrolase of the HAD superfamily
MPYNPVIRIKEISAPLLPEVTDLTPFLQKFSHLKAIVFDIYGTLFISSSGDVGAHDENRHAAAFSDALAACSVNINSCNAAEIGATTLIDEIKKQHREMQNKGTEFPEIDIKVVMANTLKRLHADKHITGCLPDTEQFIIEYEFRANQTWPMPNLSESLSLIKETGLKLGIVSNAQFYTPLMIESHLGVNYQETGFSEDICIWSYLQKEGKPSLSLYKKLRECLQAHYAIAPEETLYVGNDMLKDIWAADQCGFVTALFAGDKRSLRQREEDERCANLKPDIILTDLLQLKNVMPE